MSAKVKLLVVPIAMVLAALNGSAVAAESGSAPLAAAPTSSPLLYWPYLTYLPYYPYPAYTLPYYVQLAQNPYLPPRPAAPPTLPSQTVYPWPFSILLPPAPAPAQTPVVPSSAPAAPPAVALPSVKASVAPAPQLSPEAQKALAEAEAAVKAARAGFTLWVPAENALTAAQEAAKAGDSGTVLKQAGVIAELTRLGVGQAQYPTTEVPAELTPEASKSLAEAEAAVKMARAGFTLWVPAEAALTAALDAAKVGDSAVVLAQAKVVAELTGLGAAQATYSSTELVAKSKSKSATKKAAKKLATAQPARKPQSAKGGAKAAAPITSKTPSPAPAAPKPTATQSPAEGNAIKPRKLCWQNGRLEECP
jgi:hypothetical protein